MIGAPHWLTKYSASLMNSGSLSSSALVTSEQKSLVLLTQWWWKPSVMMKTLADKMQHLCFRAINSSGESNPDMWSEQRVSSAITVQYWSSKRCSGYFSPLWQWERKKTLPITLFRDVKWSTITPGYSTMLPRNTLMATTGEERRKRIYFEQRLAASPSQPSHAQKPRLHMYTGNPNISLRARSGFRPTSVEFAVAIS